MTDVGRGGGDSVALIGVLALTQLIGWGFSFDFLAVVGRPVARDLGMANEVAFAGLSVMMVVAAVLGPLVGGRLTRHGAARVLAEGSVLFVIGLTVLSAAVGPVTWLAAWAVVGAGGSFGLMVAANTAVVERRGAEAKRGIGTLMIFTGLSAAISWPIASLLLEAIGWRATCLVGAATHLFVCLPAHLRALPPRPAEIPRDVAAEAEEALPPAAGSGTLLVIGGITTAFTFVAYGVSPSLLEIFRQAGATPALALQLGSARSVFGVSARLVDVALGRRSSPLATIIVAGGLIVIGLLLLPIADGAFAFLGGFALLYGFGTGIATVARVLLPLQFFAPADFGRLSSRLALPQYLANAAAPVIFTAVLDRGGVDAVVALAVATLAFAVLAAVGLALRPRRPAAVDEGLVLDAIPTDCPTTIAEGDARPSCRRPGS